tara:strand:+ start:2100 stop:4166 length:2067 start_codon:yes stop_codon:yes gene_type:complete
MNPFSALFQPVSIGNMQLRNRIAMSAMTTNYGSADFEVTERLIAFHEARARGGAGLLTVEMCSVDVAQRYQPQALSLGDDRFIAGHRELVRRVHAQGSCVQPQISHPGPESMTDPVGPSVCVAAGTGWPCRALAEQELEPIMEQYAAAAVRAREAGYDGVELHAAHAYMLLGSFLSPQRNRRDDGYGGQTLETRSRLLLETIARIKRATGADFPLTLRISGHEGSFDGRELTETQRLAPKLVAAGVDCLQISGGVSHDRLVGQIVCGADTADGHNTAVAAAVRQVVSVPVMVVGRLHSPELSVQVVNEGRADIVMWARPLLADPELPEKLRNGRRAEVRECLSCQNCIDSMLLAPFDANMHCAVNGFSGREHSLRPVPVERRKRVVVIGAGTAGLEAARQCAGNGHEVILLERGPRSGGSLFLAATVHGANEPLLHYLRAEVQRLGVDLRLNTCADRAGVSALAPDAVIVATGARVAVADVPGGELPHVLQGPVLRQALAGRRQGLVGREPLWGWLARCLPAPFWRHLQPRHVRALARRWLPFGKRVCIVGDDLVALELAEFLQRLGRRVTLLTQAPVPALDVGPKRRQEQLARFDRLGGQVLAECAVRAITAVEVIFRCGEREGRLGADSVVLAGTPCSDATLASALQGAAAQVFSIGDCTGPGLIAGAVVDATHAACAIGRVYGES